MSADRAFAALALASALAAGGFALTARQDAAEARREALDARAATKQEYSVAEQAVGNLQRRMWALEEQSEKSKERRDVPGLAVRGDHRP